METVVFDFFQLNRIFQQILHSGWWKRFLTNYKSFAFIQNFFLLEDTIHEIKCRPIFRRTLFLLVKTISLGFTDIPASGSSFFGLVETEFLSNPSLGLLYKDLGHFETAFLFGAFFLLLENITEIRCKPVFFGFFSS